METLNQKLSNLSFFLQDVEEELMALRITSSENKISIQVSEENHKKMFSNKITARRKRDSEHYPFERVYTQTTENHIIEIFCLNEF